MTTPRDLMTTPPDAPDAKHTDPTLRRLTMALNCLAIPVFMAFSLLAMPLVGNAVVAEAADILHCRLLANDPGACSIFGWHFADLVSSYEASLPGLGLKNPVLALKAFVTFIELPIGNAWTMVVLGLLIWLSIASERHRRSRPNR